MYQLINSSVLSDSKVNSEKSSFFTERAEEKDTSIFDELIDSFKRLRSGTKNKKLSLIVSSSSDADVSNESFVDKSDIEFYCREVHKILATDFYEPGEISKTQIYLENLSNTMPDKFGEIFQESWLKLFNKDKTTELEKFVGIVSGIPRDTIGSAFADALIIGAYSNQSIDVREAVIRAIEAWECKTHIQYLEEMVAFKEEWLEEYRQEVLQYLRDV